MGNYRAQSFPVLSGDWRHRGFNGSGAVQELFGTLAGRTALVVGSGGTIEDILDDVRLEFRRSMGSANCTPVITPVVFAVNDIGMYLDHVDHFVSLHGEKLLHWAGIRKDGTSKPVYREFWTHTGKHYPAGIDYHWDGLTPLMPLSGYFAMQIAWIMGAERIVLIGCPGDATKRFFDAKPKPGERYSELGIRKQIEDEMRRIPEFKRAVRSTSGWTKEFFGDL